jgi:hypothetical protein
LQSSNEAVEKEASESEGPSATKRRKTNDSDETRKPKTFGIFSNNPDIPLIDRYAPSPIDRSVLIFLLFQDKSKTN